MALLINKIPWTQQPQVPVGIDWGNPVTRGISSAFNYSGFDAVKGLALSKTGDLVVSPTTCGLSNGSSGTAYFSLATRNIVAPTNTAFSVVGTIKLNNASQTSKYIALLRDGGGTGNQAAVVFGYVANKVEFFAPQFTGSDPRTGSQLTILDVNPHTFAYCYDGSNWAGYLDGVQIFSVSRTFNCNIADTNLVSTILSANGSNTLDGAVVQWSTFSRGLSPSEARSVTTNPWQIFQPLQRRIFVSIPSGGLEAIFSDNLDYYSIRGLIDSSVNLNYNIRTFTQTDKSSVFNVRTNTAVDNSVTYVLRNLVQTNAAAGYNVRGNASLDASANYNIRTISDNINTASYSIRAIVNNINNASYNLRGVTSSDKSSAFNVRGLAANSLGIVYNLRGSAYSDSLNNYTVLSASSVSAAVTAVYNLRNLVNNTISSSFNINSNVTQSILDEYKVRTSALSNNNSSYNIRSNILRDIITNYQINPAVQYVYSDLNCYYNIITSMISPNEVARVKIYPSRLITTYDVERVKRIIA